MNEELAGLTVRVDADIEPMKAQLREASTLGRQFGRSITRAFEDAVFKGKDLGDVLRNLALSLSKMAFRAAFKPLEQAVGGMFSQVVGGFAGSVGGLFSDAGGMAAPASLGADLGRALQAVPQAAMAPSMGGTGVRAHSVERKTTINFNVQSPDAAGFKRSEQQINTMLNRAVTRGERNL